MVSHGCARRRLLKTQPRVCPSSQITSNNLQRPLLTRDQQLNERRLITIEKPGKPACTQSGPSTHQAPVSSHSRSGSGPHCGRSLEIKAPGRPSPALHAALLCVNVPNSQGGRECRPHSWLLSPTPHHHLDHSSAIRGFHFSTLLPASVHTTRSEKAG